ncbi:RNA-binding domain-containing protein [Psychrobacter lutiphocae]|uniref:RNA-binding domain-containing protein n=1 Tax=Psychrobacter lutiphocae TaxID=540500 RepID=UPI000380C7EB|nr:RNA-binding domain-containing protein [Psychrobacter lutiphocae]
MLNAIIQLSELLDANENEVVEFKEAKTQYDFKKLCKYFSALSNEANLKAKACAWLVLGVNDDKNIVGTQAYLDGAVLDKLKKDVADRMTGRVTFTDIFEVNHPNGRVLMLQIPPAPQGMPIASDGHFYGRDGSSLGALNINELETIRASFEPDWSRHIIHDADIEDLDPDAIAFARQRFAEKNPKLIEDIKGWDDRQFLDKAKLTFKGQITRTAILLLGKSESEYFINPASAKITWILKDKEGIEKDYEHYTCPLLLAVDEVFGKIRNLKYRYMQGNTLFPEEVEQYDPYLIRESLNNAIAHQDYARGGRITLVEFEDGKLVIKNEGKFIPASVEAVIKEDAPEHRYRNKFLVQAMVNLNMIDTIGSGIKKMFIIQRNKFFPLPEYDLTNNKVEVTIYGKVLDLAYAQKLAQSSDDLSLEDIMLLDKVQKGKLLTDTEAKYLKGRQLIEGRRPNYHISKHIAEQTDDMASYIKNKGFNNQYYKDVILKCLEDFGPVKRAVFDDILFDKLPEVLSEQQKKVKVRNLLQDLRKQDKIAVEGKTWKLKD